VIWPTAAHPDDHFVRHAYKPMHPKGTEGPVLWPTAAYPDDHTVRHSNKHLHPKENLLSHCFEATSPQSDFHLLHQHDRLFFISGIASASLAHVSIETEVR